ncbi:hypothetical protein BDR22DRAFT_892205 [Usnea florida]
MSLPANNLQSANMPPHFTTLPREIRDAILELCLVVGVIDPHPVWEDWNPFLRSTRKPDISLLAVNKSINAEGTEIFYGKNVWVINWPSSHEGTGEWIYQETMDKIWHIHHDQIRHVRIPLNLPEACYYYRTCVGYWEKYRMMIEACQWKFNICRELGFESVTIDTVGCASITHPSNSDWIKRCCLEPLLDWVRSDEETRFAEPSPVLVRRYPNITIVSSNPDHILAVRQEWEEQWGPLNYFIEDGWHCLDGFFQPRDAKTIGNA